MKKHLLISALIFGLSVSAATAQTAPANNSPRPAMNDIGIAATLAMGDVSSIDTAANKIILKTKDGDIAAMIDAKTVYKRVSPDNPNDLKAASGAALSDISVGDRVIAVGQVAADKKSLPARQVILMTKADISKRLGAENEAWRNGVNGKISAVNPQNGEVTILVSGMGGERAVVVETANAKLRRYAPNSVKYSDSTAATLRDLRIGDRLRARGTKTPDNLRIAADEVISGSFRTIAGKIKTIDAANNQVTITDAQSKKDIVITMRGDTTLKRFPLEMAQRMAVMQTMMQSGGAMPNGGQMPARPNGGQPNGSNNPNSANTPNRPPMQGGASEGQMSENGRGMGTRGRNMDEMFENLPSVTIADLKVGEAIAVSSTSTDDLTRATAIKLVAGIEPFLAVPQITVGRRASGGGGVSIPGLDDFGAP